MDTRPKEHEIEKHLEDECIARGWLCYKTSSPSYNGFPDRTIITNTGRIVFVEVKRPKEVPRKLQVRILSAMRDHGADVCVAHDHKSVEALVSALDKDRMPPVADDRTFYVIAEDQAIDKHQNERTSKMMTNVSPRATARHMPAVAAM